MLRIEWMAEKSVVITGLNANGINLAMPWTVRSLDPGDIPEFISTHTYGETDTKPVYGSMSIPDNNSMEWGPSVLPDNWCHQEAITGEITISTVADQFKESLERDEYGWFVPGMPSKTYMFDGFLRFDTSWGAITEYSGSIEGGQITVMQGHHYGVNPVTWDDKYEITYSFERGGYTRTTVHTNLYWGWTETSVNWVAYLDNLWTELTFSKIIQPWMYRDRYYHLTDYVRNTFENVVSKIRRVGNDEWHAALEATDGFNPYDINMVENLFGASMEDVCPKGTAGTVLDILTNAVNRKGGLSNPKGIISGAQIFANCYLYYKYVANGNYSDFSQLAIGDDKKFIVDAVKDIYAADPNYVPTSENWRLKFIAEQIVHKGTKSVTKYGTCSDNHSTLLGEMRSITRARLKAYPRYLEDMSAASYVCEQFGLSLTAERLVQVIPYEFVAEWFFPIEETIHSIENNADVLAMRYKVENLCLSRKDRIVLDMNFLLAMFGLSEANGQLYYKVYDRRSQLEFPPTVLDLTLHPSMTLSRWMQGSSLVLTHLG